MVDTCIDEGCVSENCISEPVEPNCVEATCDITVAGCPTVSCDVLVLDGICLMECPMTMECNKPAKFDLVGCVCSSCTWSVISAPAGGSMRFYRSTGQSVIGVASVEGKYVIQACCND